MTYEDLIYKEDLIAWSNVEDVKVLYALSNPTSKVEAHVGYINDLLPDLGLNWENTAAIICASPRRIKAVAKDLLKLGMKGTNIYTSLETHMRCGIGKCGHCKVGSKYMCIDGPVFNYNEMLELPPEF
jgi:NAD(P)H-flavin reductase